jgi:hypothetical protein
MNKQGSPRIIFAASMVSLTTALTAWDIHNWHVIIAMGTAWDTGSPWNYQASEVLLRLFDFPAYLVGMPIANLLKLTAPLHHFVVFPLAMLFWGLVALLPARKANPHVRQHGWPFFTFLSVLTALCVWAWIAEFSAAYQWWMAYGSFSMMSLMVLIELMTPAFWISILLGFVLSKRRPAAMKA